MEETIIQTIRKGLRFLVSLQGEDGSWRGDYGGPMFLLPMYIAACYITESDIPKHRKKKMAAYFLSVQNEDGSIGIHPEAKGCMFTTVLCYVAMRILELDRENASLKNMRGWIISNGTALAAASWGKFILSLLNLYKYEGINPILPELMELPSALPIHPRRLWCHARQVYLPMAYLYALKAQMQENDLIRELRADLYDRPYDEIPFEKHRNTIANSDNFMPVSLTLRFVNQIMAAYERLHSTTLRKRAVSKTLDHINYEDKATNYIDIGPVNSVLNTIVHHFNDPGGPEFKKSFAALEKYLWEAADGTKMNGYNSSALWDTAFAVQSILATSFVDDYKDSLQLAHGYIRDNQITEDVPQKEKYFRHACVGGWPFSDRDHGWPVTDCTSEGFKCAVALEPFSDDPVPEHLLKESINLILSFQNKDGGWATYEKQRAGKWLELLNPSQVFGNIMVDYSYVECTSTCIQALVRARRRFPGRFNREMEKAIHRGIRFIRKKQRVDGSWEGSWGVCFTYGTWFGIWGLIAAGFPQNAPEIRRACGFILHHQNPDGGWGESHLSCSEGRYVRHLESQTVNTAWALLTLARAGLAHTEATRRAALFLINRQQKDGDWPPESMTGVFNKTVLINYENYRRYFPIWALAEYQMAQERNCDPYQKHTI